ncbi:hypothetical protein IJ090_00925 [Candidatus Saccharibacteria bacterium]|nr:hypothetical protein [Candidatus Saccharibacteria bacterium]
MKKSIFTLGLMLVAASFGIKDVSALNNGSLSCDNLKATLRSDSNETGSAIITLAEDCVGNLTIKSGQNITLDTAGHSLSSASGNTLTVADGGKLVLVNYSAIGTISGTTFLSNSGTTEIRSGKFVGQMVEPDTATDATLSITGGTFTVDPSDYVADGYTTSEQNGLFVVTSDSADDGDGGDEAPFDTSKITATNESLKTALVDTLSDYIDNPDTSSENGRMLAQLVNSLRQGHILSVSLVINDDPDITENVLQLLLEETAGLNLASIYDITFVVNDMTNSSLSVSLKQLVTPVQVTIPIPDQYKAALATRDVEMLHVLEEDGEYLTDTISDTAFDASGNVTFETFEFSLFALTYDGEPITASSTGDTSVPLTNGTDTTGDVVVPNTAGFFGVELTVFHLLMLSGITLVVSVFIAYAIKRAYLRNKISLK